MKSHERPSFVIYSYSYFYLCMCYLIFVENICVNFVAYDSKVISSYVLRLEFLPLNYLKLFAKQLEILEQFAQKLN